MYAAGTAARSGRSNQSTKCRGYPGMLCPKLRRKSLSTLAGVDCSSCIRKSVRHDAGLLSTRQSAGLERSDRRHGVHQLGLLRGGKILAPFHDDERMARHLKAGAKVHGERPLVAAVAEPRDTIVELAKRCFQQELSDASAALAFRELLARQASIESLLHAHSAAQVRVAVANPVEETHRLFVSIRPAIG